ncbi:OpgC domain-containing protein [Marinobacterium sp. D7]|uniref:OpgC domain-containing protein n=1 Tax=Marinobacterium ramblicola TaxID=2849041 RepID=UPI001C2D84E0|nr:OpgC domain-containing protein [Marinobacterium ramblicola]MBV1787706.1 OpgC domain-containing protein [Marinobacterium ramblicola]
MSATALVRDRRLDTLRGMFLVIMLIDHLGGYIASFTYQPFGFMSAAEGFIFLSGLMFGQIYARYVDEPSKLVRRSLARAWLIYRYHATMVLLLAALALLPFFDSLWYWALRPYREAPLTTLLAMLALVHQPGYLDILPMYVLFVLISPTILLALQRGRFLLVVGGSVMLWCAGQWVDPLRDLYNSQQIQLHPGYFNLFSWQVLWMAGLVLGYARLTGVSVGFARERGLLWLALACALVLWVWRREYVLPGPFVTSLLDKLDLGPLRLFNCMALVLIGWRLMDRFRLDQYLPFFELLGRYSIQVFSFHAVLLYTMQYTTGTVRALGAGWFALYSLALVLCLLIPVVVTRRFHRQPNGHLLTGRLG